MAVRSASVPRQRRVVSVRPERLGDAYTDGSTWPLPTAAVPQTHDSVPRSDAQSFVERVQRLLGEEVSDARLSFNYRGEVASYGPVSGSIRVSPRLIYPVRVKRNRPSTSRLVFLPSSVRVCVARRIRRQVLFARGVAGRRFSSPGPYKRNYYSQFSC